MLAQVPMHFDVNYADEEIKEINMSINRQIEKEGYFWLCMYCGWFNSGEDKYISECPMCHFGMYLTRMRYVVREMVNPLGIEPENINPEFVDIVNDNFWDIITTQGDIR